MSDADNVTLTDDAVYYRASSLGGCIRSLVAARLGVPKRPPTGKTLEIFEMGKEQEPEVQDWVRSQGFTVTDDQMEVVLHVGGNIYVRGHIDGIAVNDATGDKYVLEIKTASPDVIGKARSLGMLGFIDSRPSYAWQISAYMHVLSLPALYVVKDRTKDCDADGAIFEDTFDLDYVPRSMADIRRRVLEVEVMARNEEYPSCEPDANSFFCSYPDICEVREVEAGESMPDGLEQTVAFYHAKKAERDALDDELKDLKREIVAVAGHGKFSSPRYHVNVRKQGTTSLDRDALKVDLGDEYQRYEKKSFYDRLEIRERVDIDG